MTITPKLPGAVDVPERKVPLPTSEMNADTFMKMFTTQLANQNPMEPTDSASFLNQFSQISSVQTMVQLQKTLVDMGAQLGSLTAASRLSQAEGMLGRTVQYTHTDNTLQQGLVNALRITPEGAVQLSMTNGNVVGIEAISQVQ